MRLPTISARTRTAHQSSEATGSSLSAFCRVRLTESDGQPAAAREGAIARAHVFVDAKAFAHFVLTVTHRFLKQRLYLALLVEHAFRKRAHQSLLGATNPSSEVRSASAQLRLRIKPSYEYVARSGCAPTSPTSFTALTMVLSAARARHFFIVCVMTSVRLHFAAYRNYRRPSCLL